MTALLLPALGRAKSSAHKAVCISNQRQIGIARQLYANDGVLATHLVSVSGIRGRGGYPLYAWYSGRDKNLFEYPAEKRIPRLVAMGKVPHPMWGWGYRQNLNGIGSAWGISGWDDGDPGIRDSDVVSPSRMIAQADGSSFGMYLGGKPDGGPSFGGVARGSHVFGGLDVEPWRHALRVARRHSG